VLRPLSDGHVLVHFHFVQASRAADLHTAASHSRGFPRAVAELLLDTGVQRFSLTLSRGQWLSQTWGHSPGPAPPGAALTSVWNNSTGDRSRRSPLPWKRLAHGLGGLLCASLGGMAQPGEWFTPSVSLGVAPGQHAVWAGLAREAVCTENLAPWLSLLPCHDAAGLAALLGSRTVTLGARHIALSVTAAAPGGAAPTLTHTLTLVLRPPDGLAQQQVTLPLLLGLGVPPRQACVAAHTAHVHVALPAHTPWRLDSPAAEANSSATVGSQMVVTSLDVSSDMQAMLRETQLVWNPPAADVPSPPPPVGVMRWPAWLGAQPAAAGWWARGHLTGRGDRHRGLVLDLFQDAAAAASQADGQGVEVTLLQVVPHWCRLNMHTLQLAADGVALLSPRLRIRPASHGGDALNIVPPRVRVPGLLDLRVAVPLQTSHVQLSVSFHVAFGRLDDFPPDVNRGIDIPPARWAIRATEAAANASRACLRGTPMRPLHCLLTRAGVSGSGDAHGLVADAAEHSAVLYTAGLLLTLPSPDASMPFNVVCFIGTAIALLHSSLLATLTRRPGFAERAEKLRKSVEAVEKANGKPSSILRRLTRRLGTLRRRSVASAPAEHAKVH
jgi:phosphatidylinositol glycan class T